ncbi:nitrile hydratase accessory protein [Pseudooceanicola onchidii]|uniref:nitrile hydratase accessory protein n=1 Tax=Pseudooceanicola onchidii TaxID=2562279 RepID=UPI0010A9E06B|nr:nitrile hydratase accessory protein [Pseudooceanicola onchidii]
MPNNPAIPGLDGDAPHFFAPWQAKAFALTVHLHDQGRFTWTEWVDTFAPRVGGTAPLPDAATTADHAEVYYLAWLDALQAILGDKGLAEAALIGEMAEVWRRAALATPHGTPILYEAGLTG